MLVIMIACFPVFMKTGFGHSTDVRKNKRGMRRSSRIPRHYANLCWLVILLTPVARLLVIPQLFRQRQVPPQPVAPRFSPAKARSKTLAIVNQMVEIRC